MATLLDDLINCILNTWDFCGSEREACRDIFADHQQTFDESLFYKATICATEVWDKCNKQALN